MPILERLLKFLDNASVGAFLGAAFAFVLVIANDWRRERKKARSLIPVLLRHARVLIASRETGAANVRASLGHSEVARNTGLRFATVRLERLAEECADQLHDRNQMALQNLAFWMDSADGLNAEALRLVDQIEEGIASPVTGENSPRMYIPALTKKLNATYGEEIYILGRIAALIDAYLSNTLNERGGIGDSP